MRAILDKRRAGLPAVSSDQFALLCAKLRGKYHVDPLTLAALEQQLSKPLQESCTEPVGSDTVAIDEGTPSSPPAQVSTSQASCEGRRQSDQGEIVSEMSERQKDILDLIPEMSLNDAIEIAREEGITELCPAPPGITVERVSITPSQIGNQ